MKSAISFVVAIPLGRPGSRNLDQSPERVSGFQVSPKAVYQGIMDEIAQKDSGVSFGEVVLHESGPFSPHRVYLQVRRSFLSFSYAPHRLEHPSSSRFGQLTGTLARGGSTFSTSPYFWDSFH